jgi:hypothetical protein
MGDFELLSVLIPTTQIQTMMRYLVLMGMFKHSHQVAI